MLEALDKYERKEYMTNGSAMPPQPGVYQFGSSKNSIPLPSGWELGLDLGIVMLDENSCTVGTACNIYLYSKDADPEDSYSLRQMLVGLTLPETEEVFKCLRDATKEELEAYYPTKYMHS